MELDNSKLLGALHQSLGEREVGNLTPLHSPPPVRGSQRREDTGIVYLKEEMAAVKASSYKLLKWVWIMYTFRMHC